MQRLNLPVGEIDDPESFSGRITCIVSPLGIRYAVVEGDPQTITGKFPKQRGTIWLTTMLAGEARLEHEDLAIDLGAGDILYGTAGGGQAALRLNTRFR